jgi:mRNA interferase MazF
VRRGEIWLADFEPVRGAETSKSRPAVIVSNNGANQSAAAHGRGVVTVVPVTSNIARILPFQVLLPAAVTGLDRDSKAQGEQVRAVDVARLRAKIGHLNGHLETKLDEALRLHLGL